MKWFIFFNTLWTSSTNTGSKKGILDNSRLDLWKGGGGCSWHPWVTVDNPSGKKSENLTVDMKAMFLDTSRATTSCQYQAGHCSLWGVLNLCLKARKFPQAHWTFSLSVMECSGLSNISWQSGWKTLRPGTGKFISVLLMAKSSGPAVYDMRQLMTYPHLHHVFVVNVLPKPHQLTFWNLDLPHTMFSIRLPGELPKHYPYKPQVHQHKQ